MKNQNKKLSNKDSCLISKIWAYEIYDSRGWPTIACVVETKNKVSGTSMVPSGASTGEKEALELRDKDTTILYGKTVHKAIKNINNIIAPKLIGLNVMNQEMIDKLMIKLDGTANKSKLGANAILAVSLACAINAAKSLNLPLYKYIATKLWKHRGDEYIMPVPMLNVINGGAHADNTIDFQEFMIMPIGAKNIVDALMMASNVFHTLEKILKSKKMNTNKGDEGGFAPNLKFAEDVLDLLVLAVKQAGYIPGIDICFAIDAAASEFYSSDKKVYVFKKAIAAKIISQENGTLTTEQMVDYWKKLVSKYPIISIEDGLDENDWEGMKLLKKVIGKNVQIVGDDTFCTNPVLTKKGIEQNIANAVLIKVNQIGSLTETLATIKLAIESNWAPVISHRSGETEDTTIADLAVAVGAGQIKTGSMSRSERIAKYNRLIRIYYELTSSNAKYKKLKSFINIVPKLVKL